MTQQIVEADKVAFIHYTLKNDAGEILDQSSEGEPLPYLHGHGNIVPGLEQQLDGREVGETFTAMVPPEQGYGQPSEAPPQPIERENFPPDAELTPGMGFFAEGPNGQPIQVFVTNVTDEHVFITTDHPLAGETLHFEVEVVEVREAEQEELEHGHPHGPGGHDH